MVGLLGKMRKQMNGAVADSMSYYGSRYGLNYGVSIPTLRDIAREEGQNHELARYLFRQQVRELQLAALHIAEPKAITLEESQFWAAGICNSELAEEAAFALLRHCDNVREIFNSWSHSQNEFTAYAAMMAVTQHPCAEIIDSTPEILHRFPTSRPIWRGIVTLLDAAWQKAEFRTSIKQAVERIREQEHNQWIIEEMQWRMVE